MQPRSIRIGTHVTTKTEGTHCPESAGYTAILKSLGRDAFVLNLLESLINFFAVCLRTYKNLLFELAPLVATFLLSPVPSRESIFTMLPPFY